MNPLPPPTLRPAPEPVWREFARAPLVPVALAASLALLVDRYMSPPLSLWITLAIGGLIAWGVAFSRRSPSAGLWLCLTTAGLVGFYHQDHRANFAADDIGTFATDSLAVVRVRGSLDEEPVSRHAPQADPLVALPRPETSASVLAVAAIHTSEGWKPASGRARLTAEGRMEGLHYGDGVEVVGRLTKPSTPANPGEWDTRARLLDQRMTAEIRTGKAAASVTRLDQGWRSSFFGWLAVLRGWGTRTLLETLPQPESGIAAALLLGDGSAMDRSEWDAFIRTGVVHVLAISGQHLVVFAAFIWFVLRVCGVRRKRGAWLVAGLILGYALLTGGRPSAMRAAVMVCVVCGGLVLRRPVLPANALAFAWLIVIALNPTDPFTAGCQLSFLSVFVLIWLVGPWLAPRELDAAQELIEESRPTIVKIMRLIGRMVAVAFAISFVLGVVNAPLILFWQNIVSPVGLVLGPPLILLTSVALIAGFLLLLVSPLGSWATFPFVWLTQGSLAGCGWLVSRADQLPGAAVYAPTPSVAWVAGFYGLLIALVLLGHPWRCRLAAALAVWTLGGLLLGSHRPPADEMRATFLSVGHGGCIVIETPDGRVLLYDAGTTTGPDVVRRTIAPFLWQRGIARIDEVFLSHADLDHFNAMPELFRRFSVGRVSLTPSFVDKPTPGVAQVLAVLDREGIERRTVSAGDQFTAGEVSLEVLHPPVEGPAGPENARSLVLLVRHAGHTLLLTGDLEKEGLPMVLERKPIAVDVLLSPHHGSSGANVPSLALWAKPRLVISSQEPRPLKALTAVYRPVGATVLDTATAGAITIHSHKTGLTAETFRTQERLVIRRGEGGQ